MRRTVAVVVVALLVATLATPVASAAPDPDAAEPVLEALTAEPVPAANADERIKHADPGLFIVRLEDDPVASYQGGKPGLERTMPDQARGQRGLDPDSPAVQRYERHLQRERERTIARIERTLGRNLDVDYVYDYVINGFAAFFTPEEAARVTAVAGVADVEPDEILELQTDNGPAWIGAPAVWDGLGGVPATRGEGVIVGILDTGINPSNPSFAGVGPIDGHVHVNPYGSGNFVGVCDPEEPAFDGAFPCNDKLIGAWDFVNAQESPANDARDVDGHGSHTASTSAGNVVDATVLSPATPGLSLEREISGVAPHANLISYRVCHETGCPTSASNAAVNQAIVDGVDVINFSIGGGSQNPWTGSSALAFLGARDAGIMAATSAGNDGPGATTVGSPGDAPWIMTVGASTHDRNIANTLTGFTGGVTELDDIIGTGFSGGYGPAPIVYAADVGDALCLEPFPPGTFEGEIVLCDRGIIARVEKGENVLAGGAGGLILANDEPNAATLNSDAHVIPAVHISFADSVDLKAWLAEGSDHAVEITGVDGVDEGDVYADLMAAFSSRGPNAQIDVITPSVTAPGLNIIAAHGVDDPAPPVWDIVSGTSMSSPHAAGAAALLVALNPDWTPDEIQSALMTTGVTDGLLKEDGETPADWFDIGAGRIDLEAASQAGFVLAETHENYVAADPRDGGDPGTLNLPSLANSQCLATCSWTRTITATTDGAWEVATSAEGGLSLTVDPASFTLTAGESQTLSITADVGGASVDEWVFGDVVFTSPDAPTAHFPVAVVPTTGVLPGLVEVETRRDAGSQPVTGLSAMESPALTVDVHGLVPATIHEGTVGQDPNNGDPYSPLDVVFWTTFDVAPGSARVVAEILATTAPDLDLFIGTGSTPSAETEQCSSTTPSSVEYCDVHHPEPGTWWVLVQNWQASGDEPDPFTLAVGVPGADTGTLSVDAPSSVASGEEFDVRLFWDAEMEEGDLFYGAFSLGSEPGSPGDIGLVPVDLVRVADDVTKTADVETAEPGDTITYEITVLPNTLPEDLEYTITDTIPDGLTYVEGSATSGATVEDGVLTWTGTMPAAHNIAGDFTVTTNATDPACAVPFGAGTWVDFQALGFGPIPGFDGGDLLSPQLFTDGAPFRYYDRSYSGLVAAPVGTAMFAPPFGAWWAPQTLPDPTVPNAVVAGLWGDFQWVHDPAAGTGFRALSLGTDTDGWAILDHDGLQLYGGSEDSWSVQQWIRRSPADAGPSIVFAYNDLGSLEIPVTVGVEDEAGVRAAAHVNNGPATGLLTDDTIVCFTYEGGGEAEVITYQVTVDDDAQAGTVTNAAVHVTDNPGAVPETASADVELLVAAVVSVSVSPATVRLRVGEEQQFTATAEYDDGTTADVTDVADWSSSNTSVATVDDDGLATAVAGGRTTVTASFGGQTGTASVQVTGRPSQPGPPPGVGPPGRP